MDTTSSKTQILHSDCANNAELKTVKDARVTSSVNAMNACLVLDLKETTKETTFSNAKAVLETAYNASTIARFVKFALKIMA